MKSLNKRPQIWITWKSWKWLSYLCMIWFLNIELHLQGRFLLGKLRKSRYLKLIFGQPVTYKILSKWFSNYPNRKVETLWHWVTHFSWKQITRSFPPTSICMLRQTFTIIFNHFTFYQLHLWVGLTHALMALESFLWID